MEKFFLMTSSCFDPGLIDCFVQLVGLSSGGCAVTSSLSYVRALLAGYFPVPLQLNGILNKVSNLYYGTQFVNLSAINYNIALQCTLANL